jgi:hypothetical protein
MAFGFICLANISIFFFGVTLSFWIGFHQMNNLIYLVETQGLAEVLSGFLSLFGLLFIGMIVLIVFYVLRSKKSNTGQWWNPDENI